MEELNLEIPGNPISKKNSMQIIRVGKRLSLVPSKQYRAYEKSSVLWLSDSKPEKPIDFPVEVTCIYFMKERRKVDLTNLLEATDDILVKAGILADDNRNIIASHDGSRVFWNKEKPTVHIKIREYADYFGYEPWSSTKVPVKKKRAAEEFDEEHWD